MPGSKQSFETRFIRLMHMLDMMSRDGGIRRDAIASDLSVPYRTLDRDISFLSRFFPITRTNDSNGARRFRFDKWRFNLEQVMERVQQAEWELEDAQNAPTLDYH